MEEAQVDVPEVVALLLLLPLTADAGVIPKAIIKGSSEPAVPGGPKEKLGEKLSDFAGPTSCPTSPVAVPASPAFPSAELLKVGERRAEWAKLAGLSVGKVNGESAWAVAEAFDDSVGEVKMVSD